ncbi:MAG: glycosyltransferase [Elusimicrobiales bacterium]|jgi:glycosyltransferase involved in cell wall biosynthesis|nr:glycosyltransferase [Elusimicrobiales bacterium]
MKFSVLSSLTARSGSSIRNRGICRALTALGHEVHYLEPLADGEDAGDVSGFVHVPLRAGSGGPLSWMLPAGLAAAGRLKALRPDAVMVMKPFPHTALPALLQRARSGCRVIMDFDDLDSGYFPAGPVRLAVEAAQLRMLRRADLVSVHNPALRSYLEDRGVGPGRISFLGQGIDPDKYLSDGSPAAELPAGWEGSGVTLVYAAHLGPAAALGPVFDALSALPGTFRLLVIGGGAALEAFRRAAAERGLEGRAHFTGYLPHARALACMRLGDIAVNCLDGDEPSAKYRSQIKLREYLALGLPVVSTAGGDVELFRDFVEIAGDPRGLAGLISKAAADLPSAKARAERGRVWVTGNQSWERLVGDWLREVKLDA